MNVTKISNYSFVISVNPNVDSLKRTGTVTLNTQAGIKTLDVVQAQNEMTVTVTSNSFDPDGVETNTIIANPLTGKTSFSTAATWLKVTQKGNSFTVDATDNFDGIPRTGVVAIHCGNITKTVTFTQNSHTIKTDVTEVFMDGVTSTTTLGVVSTDANWTASDDRDWITANKTGIYSLLISVETNSDSSVRSGTVTLTACDGKTTCKVTVVQYGRKLTIRLDPNGGTLSRTSVTRYFGQPLGEIDVEKKWKDDTLGFEGWYTLPEGGVKVPAHTVIRSDMTLYAHWSKKHDVKYFCPNVVTLEPELIDYIEETTYCEYSDVTITSSVPEILEFVEGVDIAVNDLSGDFSFLIGGVRVAELACYNFVKWDCYMTNSAGEREYVFSATPGETIRGEGLLYTTNIDGSRTLHYTGDIECVADMSFGEYEGKTDEEYEGMYLTEEGQSDKFEGKIFANQTKWIILNVNRDTMYYDLVNTSDPGVTIKIHDYLYPAQRDDKYSHEAEDNGTYRFGNFTYIIEINSTTDANYSFHFQLHKDKITHGGSDVMWQSGVYFYPQNHVHTSAGTLSSIITNAYKMHALVNSGLISNYTSSDFSGFYSMVESLKDEPIDEDKLAAMQAYKISPDEYSYFEKGDAPSKRKVNTCCESLSGISSSESIRSENVYEVVKTEDGYSIKYLGNIYYRALTYNTGINFTYNNLHNRVVKAPTPGNIILEGPLGYIGTFKYQAFGYSLINILTA